MLGFGKTAHENIRSAVGTTYDESTKDDCAHLVFETPDRSFTIQYLNQPEHGDLFLNVTGLDDATRHSLRQSLDFPVIESGRNFITLDGSSTSVAEGIEEIELVVNELEATLSDVTETKSFAAAKPNPLANIKSMLGLDQ